MPMFCVRKFLLLLWKAHRSDSIAHKILRTEPDECKGHDDLRQIDIHFLFDTSDETGKGADSGKLK